MSFPDGLQDVQIRKGGATGDDGATPDFGSGILGWLRSLLSKLAAFYTASKPTVFEEHVDGSATLSGAAYSAQSTIGTGSSGTESWVLGSAGIKFSYASAGTGKATISMLTPTGTLLKLAQSTSAAASGELTIVDGFVMGPGYRLQFDTDAAASSICTVSTLITGRK